MTTSMLTRLWAIILRIHSIYAIFFLTYVLSVDVFTLNLWRNQIMCTFNKNFQSWRFNTRMINGDYTKVEKMKSFLYFSSFCRLFFSFIYREHIARIFVNLNPFEMGNTSRCDGTFRIVTDNTICAVPRKYLFTIF